LLAAVVAAAALLALMVVGAVVELVGIEQELH
jgi:hypothetical protein